MLSAVLGVISSYIHSALVAVWTIFKFTLLILFAYSFFIAIQSLIQVISNIVITSIIGEFFALISVYLPFNANVIFGAIITICDAILAFIIARKIWNMYKELFASAH